MKEPIKELSDEDYTRFRKNLLRSKGSDNQKNFLKNVKNSESFPQYMQDSIRTIGKETVPTIAENLTENEFKDPPVRTEIVSYNTWRTLSPSLACRTTFWAHVTIMHVSAGIIQSDFLAANGGGMNDGSERIDIALVDDTENGKKLIDDCVRTVLRRLGGLPEVRGSRSVYVDCPFARSWWREYMVSHAAQGSEELAKLIRKVFRSKQIYWEKFIDRVVFRSPTLGSENVRSAFMRALALHSQDNPKSELLQAKGLQRLCRRAGVYQGWQELSILDNREIDELMSEVVENSLF